MNQNKSSGNPEVEKQIPDQVRDDDVVLPKELLATLQKQIQGEVVYDEETLVKYSHDTSIFEIKPFAVVYPKSVLDVSIVVKFVQDNKFTVPLLAITPRSGGSDMTGGSIGQGLIIDVTKYLNQFEIDFEGFTAHVQPGVFYRDFEPKSLERDLVMPVFPASKNLAAFGGMISNNCAGEKSLRYGQMRNFVDKIKVVLANGSEYEFKELTFDQVQEIIDGKDEYIAGIYRRLFHMIDQNYEFILGAKPKTSKNSSGYALWQVMDKEKKTFNLAHLFIGAQGTLGILTDAHIRLIKEKPHQKIITVFLPSWSKLPSLVNSILAHEPESLEVFDDTTLKLGLRFFPEIAKRVGKSLWQFLIAFAPEFVIGVKMLGLPKLIMLIELSCDTEEELREKVAATEVTLETAKAYYRTIPTADEAEKYFVVRRESFNLLRQKVKGKNTAPFIEDFCVLPEKLPEFLPALLKILKRYKIAVNVAGHAGNGNLHIIPLMDLKDPKEREKITKVAEEVYALIISYGGTITAEHNDGIIRTPFVRDLFGERMYLLFKEVKGIFDPSNIFNPGKKVDGELSDIDKWMKKG